MLALAVVAVVALGSQVPDEAVQVLEHSGTVAIVNGTPIYRETLDRELEPLIARGKPGDGDPSSPYWKQLADRALGQLIDRLLIEAEARKQRLWSAPPSISTLALYERLNAHERNYLSEFTISRHYESVILAMLGLDAQNAYRLKQTSRGCTDYPCFDFLEIRIDEANGGTQLATECANAIRSGAASFDTLARLFSSELSSANGGLRRSVASAQLPNEIVNALEELEPGQVTSVRVGNAYYVLQVLRAFESAPAAAELERLAEERKDADRVRSQIDEFRTQLRSNASIQRLEFLAPDERGRGETPPTSIEPADDAPTADAFGAPNQVRVLFDAQ